MLKSYNKSGKRKQLKITLNIALIWKDRLTQKLEVIELRGN